MKCGRKDCSNEAKWQLGWCAWAEGYPKTSNAKIEARIGLAVCDDHKADTTLSDLLTPDGNAMVNNRLLAMRKKPLDFSTAELRFYEVIDGKLEMPGR